jgi:class 3 adenylate cyclase
MNMANDTQQNLKRSFVDRALTTLFPVLLIPERAWLKPWEQRDSKAFLVSSRVYFGTMCAIYVAHFVFVDVPANKEPLWLWASYRGGCAALHFIGLLLTLSSEFMESQLKRVPIYIITAICVYMQGKSMEWLASIPPFYVPVLAAFGVLALRSSIAVSALSLIAILAPSFKFFILRPFETHHMVSATLVSFAILAVFRSRQKQDIQLFVAEQMRLKIQTRLIESQQLLLEQVRTFLPKELFRRVELLMSRDRMTPLQATDEVLRPRETKGAVLHTDIRGFTQLTKLGSGAVLDAVIPAQRLCSETIDKYRGISRLQGDLVFAYFDLESPKDSLLSATISGIEMLRVIDDLNVSLVKESNIKRYAIITFGKIIVGNLGGSEGSRDVCAIGNAANLPSRIDPLTKESALSQLLKEHPVILSQEAWNELRTLSLQLDCIEADLEVIGLKLRDFPEETKLFLVRASEANLKQLIEAKSRLHNLESSVENVEQGERNIA